MKRGRPLERSKGLEPRLDQIRSWQRRTRDAAVAGMGSKATRRRAGQRRSADVKYRADVLALRGEVCRSCGDTSHVEVDHLIPRLPSNRLVIANGTPLCGDFGRGRCHPRKTDHLLLVQRSWLDADQVRWLEDEGHAWWLPDGSVAGPRSRIFAPLDPGDTP